jgi:hypothetical protein
LFDSLIVSDYELLNIKVEIEKSIEKVGRLDIYIESNIVYAGKEKKLKIIIENKVGTKEHSDQTLKYYKYFESNKTEDEINLYVFLTPISGIELVELEEPECSSKDFIQINYQSLVDFLFEPIIKTNISDKTKIIIKEYLQSLSQPTIDKDEDKFKQGLIMALGTDERNLLTKFWDKNQKLILAALYAISSDPEQDKDIRDSASTALINLAGSNKDRSRYSIFYNGNKEVDKITKSDIGYQTVKILKNYKLIDNKLFDMLRKDTTCKCQLLKKRGEVTKNQYSKYRINNKPELNYNNDGFYVARNWGKENTDEFIKKMTKKIPGLSYKKHN